MEVFAGEFSVSSTGNIAIPFIPFPPKKATFVISSTDGGSDTIVMYSSGYAVDDGENDPVQRYDSTFYGNDGRKTHSGDTRCINHVRGLSGTPTDIIKASFISFDTDGFGTYECNLNFTAVDGDYDIGVTFEG